MKKPEASAGFLVEWKIPWMDFCGNAAWVDGELVSTTIGSGFTDCGGGVDTKKLLVEETFWGVEVGAAAVAVFVAALITDLKLKMLLKPLETLEFVPGALERLALSWMEFEFVPPPLIIPSIPVPPITTAAAAPINDDPINPDVVDGLSKHVWFDFFSFFGWRWCNLWNAFSEEIELKWAHKKNI